MDGIISQVNKEQQVSTLAVVAAKSQLEFARPALVPGVRQSGQCLSCIMYQHGCLSRQASGQAGLCELLLICGSRQV